MLIRQEAYAPPAASRSKKSSNMSVLRCRPAFKHAPARCTSTAEFYAYNAEVEFHTASAEQIQDVAAHFARGLAPRILEATVIALSGELGAGKTTFAQGVARALGVGGVVASPTFVIEKVYELQSSPPAGGWRHLVHIDAYRLKSAQELELLGWKELVADAGNLILLEWPERVAELVPQDAIRIEFDIAGEGRTITINGEESSGEKIASEVG
jgi:tRNA threonylcarbamoyladenosine biosynthesis protein TsaE